jgi:glycosyltransferase involved in cell wall biosynthesis
MRVIQLGPFPPPHGGVQTNLVAIRDHLRAHGHGAGVVHLSRHRKADADEVYYPKTALATAQVLLTQPADILHLHIGGQLNNRLLALCLFCVMMPGRKSVLTFHSGGFCSSPEGQAIHPGSKASILFRRLDAIIAVNQQIKDFFIERCGVPERRVHLISPHASARAAGDLPTDLQEFFDAHDPLLLSVGLLEPEYDLPVQIETLGRIRETHPQAGLLMIGSGSLEAELRARIAGQPYASHLLLAGDVPHQATLRAIHECRMLLRTTHYDGDALSVREALESGTPVIATDNGMRPAGCHLIPAPPSREPLREQIEAVLASAPVVDSGTKNLEAGIGTQNLDAVLDLYQSLLA